MLCFPGVIFPHVNGTIYDRTVSRACAILRLFAWLAVNGDQSVGQLALNIPFEVVAELVCVLQRNGFGQYQVQVYVPLAS